MRACGWLFCTPYSHWNSAMGRFRQTPALWRIPGRRDDVPHLGPPAAFGFVTYAARLSVVAAMHAPRAE